MPVACDVPPGAASRDNLPAPLRLVHSPLRPRPPPQLIRLMGSKTTNIVCKCVKNHYHSGIVMRSAGSLLAELCKNGACSGSSRARALRSLTCAPVAGSSRSVPRRACYWCAERNLKRVRKAKVLHKLQASVAEMPHDEDIAKACASVEAALRGVYRPYETLVRAPTPCLHINMLLRFSPHQHGPPPAGAACAGASHRRR